MMKYRRTFTQKAKIESRSKRKSTACQKRLLYIPIERRFPIGGDRVSCQGSKLANSIGKQKLEISFRT